MTLASNSLDISHPFSKDEMVLIRRTKYAPQYTVRFTPISQADTVAEKTVYVTRSVGLFREKMGMVIIPDL